MIGRVSTIRDEPGQKVSRFDFDAREFDSQDDPADHEPMAEPRSDRRWNGVPMSAARKPRRA